MQTFQADLAIVGAGGAGLRAAIAAAQANPNAKIALISKVYPMFPYPGELVHIYVLTHCRLLGDEGSDYL